MLTLLIVGLVVCFLGWFVPNTVGYIVWRIEERNVKYKKAKYLSGDSWAYGSYALLMVSLASVFVMLVGMFACMVLGIEPF